jgi:uncharacterized protein (TIGR00730 family)
MEAANLGAMQYLRECNINGDCRTKRVSAGVGLVRLNKERVNPYVQENIIMEHFFARKWLLVRYSVGFIVFPGGFGTMDELFEIITLMQCNRMAHMPVVLMGTNYWEPLMTWIHSRALAEKFINAEDTEMFTVTDDINVAVEKIRSGCIDCTESVSYNGMVKK